MKAREVRAGLVLWERYQKIDVRTDNDGRDDQRYVWQTDEEWLHREALLEDEGVPSGFNQTYSFSWPLPTDAPPPCEGRIVQIRYLVKVTVDRAMARDLNEELVLPIAVSPPGRNVEGGEFGRSKDSEARMRLTLPRLEFVEGETISGKLSIDPRQAYDTKEIRLELTRREVVIPGDRTHRTATTEQKLQLSPAQKLLPGVIQEYDFSLPLPAKACPSHDTSKTKCTWELEGIISRSMRDDTNVAQEIYVYTAPPPDAGENGAPTPS
jgi:hypothetical protein